MCCLKSSIVVVWLFGLIFYFNQDLILNFNILTLDCLPNILNVKQNFMI